MELFSLIEIEDILKLIASTQDSSCLINGIEYIEAKLQTNY